MKIFSNLTSSRWGRFLLILLVVALNLACDQVTKHIATTSLERNTTVQVIGTVFVLQYAQNDGAFLSMGSSLPSGIKPFLLTAMPMLLLLMLLVHVVYQFVVKQTMNSRTAIPFACVIGGGFGNMVDRITQDGYVVDFMNFGIGSLRTGILNVADLSITFGVLFLVVVQILENRNTGKKIL